MSSTVTFKTPIIFFVIKKLIVINNLQQTKTTFFSMHFTEFFNEYYPKKLLNCIFRRRNKSRF